VEQGAATFLIKVKGSSYVPLKSERADSLAEAARKAKNENKE
jgi:hypothetical protein